MSIEIKASNGITVTLNDFSSLIDLMSDEQQLELIETLSCYDAVLKHVTDQIIDLNGITENGYGGSSLCGHEKHAGNGTALDKARYAVACGAGDVSRQLIEAQSRNLKDLQIRLDHANDELHKLRFKSN